MASHHEAPGPESLANPSFTLAVGAVALWMYMQRQFSLKKNPAVCVSVVSLREAGGGQASSPLWGQLKKAREEGKQTVLYDDLLPPQTDFQRSPLILMTPPTVS